MHLQDLGVVLHAALIIIVLYCIYLRTSRPAFQISFVHPSEKYAFSRPGATLPDVLRGLLEHQMGHSWVA